MNSPRDVDEKPARLGPSAADLVALFVLAPGVGMAIGLALPWVATLASDLPWVPFQGPLELVASVPGGWGTAIGLIAGLVLGVALALITIRDALRVTVAADAVTLDKGGARRRVARTDVSAVFLDEEHLVVLDGASRELVREEVDARQQRIEHAFRQHDYPWCRVDPFADAFQRWVRDTPDLPGSLNAVFAAREVSLRKADSEESDDLRAELMKKGYVVRDQKARQYWRAWR